MVAYENGKIPADLLERVLNFRPLYSGVTSAAGSDLLRQDARDQLRLLQFEFFRVFGKSLDVSEAYRGLTRQTAVWQIMLGGGPLAAVVGTSNHGWATACDFGYPVSKFGTPEKIWMDANAPLYGWHPTGNGFTRPEAWHYDYTPGTATIIDLAGSGAVPLDEEFTVAQFDTIMAQLGKMAAQDAATKAAVGAIHAALLGGPETDGDLLKLKRSLEAVHGNTVADGNALDKIKVAVGPDGNLVELLNGVHTSLIAWVQGGVDAIKGSVFIFGKRK